MSQLVKRERTDVLKEQINGLSVSSQTLLTLWVWDGSGSSYELIGPITDIIMQGDWGALGEVRWQEFSCQCITDSCKTLYDSFNCRKPKSFCVVDPRKNHIGYFDADVRAVAPSFCFELSAASLSITLIPVSVTRIISMSDFSTIAEKSEKDKYAIEVSVRESDLDFSKKIE